MTDFLISRTPKAATPLVPITKGRLAPWLRGQSARVRNWVKASGFTAAPESACLVPDASGGIDRVLAGISGPDDPFAIAHLPPLLKRGDYVLDVSHDRDAWPPDRLEQAAVGYGLGCYRFTRYRQAESPTARLALPPRCDLQAVRGRVAGIGLTRDLINTPAADMMPEDLAAAAERLAADRGGKVTQVIGKDLLRRNYPAIHAVGRASEHAPRLIDLRFARRGAPKLTLVGKGVCFDSGGLDLKSATGMRHMKKDMGGAAHALGLASMLLSADVKAEIRVLVSAVENAVSGNAYRPGDILKTRAGLTVEVDNTDAEGRIVLADALTEALSGKPDLVIDFATLTGAARVALGTEVPAMFTPSDAVASGIAAAAGRVHDPVWRLPLHGPYSEMLKSHIADLRNAPGSPYGGAITAALFLQKFVPDFGPWVHFDIMAYNVRARPGRPEGGEAMGLRALLAYLGERNG